FSITCHVSIRSARGGRYEHKESSAGAGRRYLLLPRRFAPRGAVAEKLERAMDVRKLQAASDRRAQEVQGEGDLMVHPAINDKTIAEGTTCQEASILSQSCYIPCGRPAV